MWIVVLLGFGLASCSTDTAQLDSQVQALTQRVGTVETRLRKVEGAVAKIAKARGKAGKAGKAAKAAKFQKAKMKAGGGAAGGQ